MIIKVPVHIDDKMELYLHERLAAGTYGSKEFKLNLSAARNFIQLEIDGVHARIDLPALSMGILKAIEKSKLSPFKKAEVKQ